MKDQWEKTAMQFVHYDSCILQEYKAAGRLLDMPDTLFTIHDNCVGQNKSQVVFKFYWLGVVSCPV